MTLVGGYRALRTRAKAYKEGGWICSYCCMSELDCGTMCRKGSVSAYFVQLSPE